MPYRIKTVADLLGVPRATLLAWERRYSVVSPARHGNGYRAYSEADVDTLRAVKRLVDQGLKVSEAVSQVQERSAPPVAHQGQALDTLRSEMFEALMVFDRDLALLAAQRTGMVSFSVQLEQLYAPLLKEVGEAWCEGRVTISQEHFSTGFVRERITAMLVALNSGPRGGERVLCSGFLDDPHELPVLMLATHLSLAGFRVTSIGVSVPVEALGQAVQASKANILSLTVTLPRSVEELETFFAELVPELPETCVVAVGGAGVPDGMVDTPVVRYLGSVEDLVAWGRSLH